LLYGLIGCKIEDDAGCKFKYSVCDGVEQYPLLELYDLDVVDYAREHDLSENWVTWMIGSMKMSYAKPYLLTRQTMDRTVRINVGYLQPVEYVPAWESEDAHMATIETLLELAYPGWDFFVGLDIENPDMTDLLGGDPVYQFADIDNATVYIFYEGIIVHEIGHIFGLTHHYCNAEHIGNEPECALVPPDEGDCIMYRTASVFGVTERFLLDLKEETYEKEILQVLTELNGHVPSVIGDSL